MRPALVLVLAVAACGQSTDDRPHTNGFITPTLLAPLCGKAECHSTFSSDEGYVLDTTHGVTTTLRYELEKVGPDSHLFNDSPVGDAQPLQRILNIRGSIFNEDPDQKQPMPYDSPMADQDAAYLLDWLAEGAPGACDASLASFCYPLSGKRVTCGADNEYVYTPDSSCN